MGSSNRIRKRLLIFLLIPILTVIPFLVEDLIVRIISAAIIVIYAAIIIFLRDSVKDAAEPQLDEPMPEEGGEGSAEYGEPDSQDMNGEEPHFETDAGEDFVIVSPNKKIEVASSAAYASSIGGNRKNFFKPPDLKQAFDKIATEEIPSDLSHDEQFGFVLERIMTVCKDAFLAHTAVLFWYNRSKERLTLEKFISSSNDISKRKFDLEDDILSKIIKSEEPELLSDISPTAEPDVIRYYSNKQGIKSFVGVPLFYGKALAGVLALDSKDIDAFGIETIYSLGRFVRVISIMISIFEKKFEEARSEGRLKALLGILSTEKKFADEAEIFVSMEQALKNLLNWDSFTFVYYHPNTQKFTTSKIVNNTTLKYIGENLEIELKNTLVGKSIITGQPVKIDDTSEHEMIRYSKSEDISFDGSFLAIPLIYDKQYYGVLCFESLKKGAYTNADVRFMMNATKVFSFIVYSYSTQNVLRGLLSLDIETRVLNLDTFNERLQADLLKQKELELPGAIALIKIDDFLDQESLFEGNPFPKVLMAISRMVKEDLPEISLFGRLSEKIFGVYFFNAQTKDVFLWSEKLRVKIARQPIAVSAKQTTYTVSIGVASTSNTTTIDNVLHNAELALNKAIEKGGNSVKSIN